MHHRVCPEGASTAPPCGAEFQTSFFQFTARYRLWPLPSLSLPLFPNHIGLKVCHCPFAAMKRRRPPLSQRSAFRKAARKAALDRSAYETRGHTTDLHVLSEAAAPAVALGLLAAADVNTALVLLPPAVLAAPTMRTIAQAETLLADTEAVGINYAEASRLLHRPLQTDLPGPRLAHASRITHPASTFTPVLITVRRRGALISVPHLSDCDLLHGWGGTGCTCADIVVFRCLSLGVVTTTGSTDACTGASSAVQSVSKNGKADAVIADARHSAVLACRRDADGGDSSAMCCLGRSYFEGVGVIRDLARSYAWYLRAGRTGHGSERCFQGACTFYRDPPTVEEMRAAYSNVDSYTPLSYGDSEYRRRRQQQMRLAAEEGHLCAQVALGSHLEQSVVGLGSDDRLRTASTLSEALAWYFRAAVSGSQLACTRLSACYASGIGVAIDESISWAWSMRGAGYATEIWSCLQSRQHRDRHGFSGRIEVEKAEVHKWAQRLTTPPVVSPF